MSFSNSMGGGGGYKPNYGSAGSNQGNRKVAGYTLTSLPTMSPETRQLFEHVLGSYPKEGLAKGLGFTGGLAGGDEGAFDQLEAPSYASFNRLSADTASRFSGEGSGARNSSGFQNAIAAGQSDLAQNMGAQRMGLQRQAIQDLLGLSQNLFGTQTHENLALKKGPGFKDYLSQGFGLGIGSVPGMFRF